MNRFVFACLTLGGMWIACQDGGQKSPTLMFNEVPADTALLFGEDVFSTGAYERDFCLSPDGSEVYYTISSQRGIFSVMVSRKRTQNGWTEAEVLPFSGRYRDLEPALSPDGQYLYFASNRPLSPGENTKDIDIWRVSQTEAGWSEPQNLGKVVNRGGDEYYPSIAANGNLYFTAAYEDAVGGEDIYVSRWENEQFQVPQPIGEGVNGVGLEFNAFVAPDESYLLFTGYRRPDGLGRGDLYISNRNPEGEWEPAQNLGPRVNSAFLDYCPFVSPDGKTLYFSSERHQLQSAYPQGLDFSDFEGILNQPLNGNGNLFFVRFESRAE